ncbi:MAG: HlyD family efflux transporter periplasmic adaptor subunit [Phycisphaerales bacterium]|nr:HlyD family efflux transporter periplasmic adaptor subunit [Phycisphaerales bacterium]
MMRLIGSTMRTGDGWRLPALAGLVGVLAVSITAGAAARPLPAAAGGAVGVSAVAQPWRDVNLSFSRAGRIEKIMVHRGDVVAKGQVLARQADQQQLLQEQMAAVAANSTVRIDAAKAQLAQDAVDLKKKQWAAARHAATDFEVEQATLKVTIDKLTVELAEVRHQRDVLGLQAAKLAVERRQIRAPFAGVIEDRYVDAGGAIAPFKKVLRLVSVGRLRIIAPVPLAIAHELHTGDVAEVIAGSVHARGTILWIGRVADAASGTVTVGIKVDGHSGIVAGEQVMVQLTHLQQAWHSGRAEGVGRPAMAWAGGHGP